MSRGIDVSNWQGYPDFRAVRGSGVEYVYIKATESTNYVSPAVDRQWNDAGAAGLVRGLYHFAQPARTSPEAEAELFARVVNAKGAKGNGFLPPCLDLETGGGHLGWFVQRFIARLRALVGNVPCIVYSGGSFYRNQVGDGSLPPGTSAWIAHYNGAPGRSSYLTGKTVMHQYTDSGRIAGVAGGCDVNWAVRPLAEIIGGSAAAAAVPGGIEELGFNDKFTDWYGNEQTTLSWMNHIDQRIAELHGALLTQQQSRYVSPDGARSEVRVSPVEAILDNNKADYENVDRVIAVRGAVDHLTEVLGSLSGLDGDAIAAKVRAAVADALEEGTVHVDIHVGGEHSHEEEPEEPEAA